MSWHTIEDQWDDYKWSARQRWGELSVAQMNAVAGRRGDLSMRLQAAYALSPQQAERQIAEWQARQLMNFTPGAWS
jgi:uncharacterized protein YjbJ (UPF0337 family)